jgi:hypothetical protein
MYRGRGAAKPQPTETYQSSYGCTRSGEGVLVAAVEGVARVDALPCNVNIITSNITNPLLPYLPTIMHLLGHFIYHTTNQEREGWRDRQGARKIVRERKSARARERASERERSRERERASE